jgi:hypothetical protein
MPKVGAHELRPNVNPFIEGIAIWLLLNVFLIAMLLASGGRRR